MRTYDDQLATVHYAHPIAQFVGFVHHECRQQYCHPILGFELAYEAPYRPAGQGIQPYRRLIQEQDLRPMNVDRAI
jgi:hypothetical protein